MTMARTALLFSLLLSPGLARAGAGADRPNILLVAIDTCRADHLSAYGYARATTPHIDALARRGVLFESAYAQSNWTLPSFASFLTGKYPRRLGMFDEGRRLSDFDYTDPELGAAETTLPEALKKAGYRTAGFFTGRYNGPDYGFAQGFDLYRDYRSDVGRKQERTESFAAFLPEALDWMEKNKDGPFFIIFNPFELHRPYLPPADFIKPYAGEYKGVLASTWFSKPVLSSIKKDGEGWSFSLDESTAAAGASRKAKQFPSNYPPVRLGPADIDYIIARYDASLTYVDKFIGELAEWADKHTPGSTIIIITGDHGEELGDHGGFLHNTDPPKLYQELIHVPLIMDIPAKWLNTGAAVVRQPVELVDLMPTILDLAGASPPPGLQGRSLARLLKGAKKEEAGRAVFAETRGYGVKVQSVKAGAWKLIRTGPRKGAPQKAELYDLASDPAEAHDLAGQEPGRVRELLDRLDAWSDKNGK